MALSLGVLLNAALGGTAAYSGGKRIGRKQKLDEQIAEQQRQINEDLRNSQMTENTAQSKEALALATLHQDQMEHPEKYRAPVKPDKPTESESYTSYFDGLVAQGKTPAEADRMARTRFGKNQEAPRAPVYGSPEYLAAVDRVEGVRDRHQTTGRDTGEAGSQKAMVDRREFIQQRIAHYMDKGLELEEATAKANSEYSAAALASGTSPFSDVSGGTGSTARALSHTIPTGSANAGTRGVKPTETASTPATNPRDPSSPKAGTLRPASDAQVLQAMAAVGHDPDAVEKWLNKRNLTGN